ncbi:MAG: PQQ-dependent sugar dehydrogenase [Ignavibacteriales bacterium]|nr:PQQ-dependent sugar dehydrogenase [Ignavibacteriales bacterium]
MIKIIFILLTLVNANAFFAQYKLQNAFPKLTFNQPLGFQDARDGTNRVFIVTQEGLIYVLENSPSVNTKKIFLDIKDKVKSGGEMGLLGLAFHPNFKSNEYIYVNYTAPAPLRTIIARFSVDKNNPDVVDKNTELKILEVKQPFENHNGGQLAFGPDGFLYIGMGDGGSYGDPQNNAQNTSVLLGKMLRINIDKSSGGRNYSIPKDNPFLNNTRSFREEIWALGLRNPWRFSFDFVSGWLWAADVGQDKWEEVDIIKKGKFYGWRTMEGNHCYNPANNCDTSDIVLPVWEYGHNDSGGYSITGGYVYRGSSIIDLYGKYIYGDYVSGKIWALDYTGISQTANQLLINSKKNISSFGTDKNDEIYVCSYDGKIYKLICSNPANIFPEKSTGYGLYYNFPNSFYPRTTIIADVKKEGQVKIEIFDSNGIKIETLIDNVVPAGRHKFLWDATGYPIGVYIYQMTAGKIHITKKLVLMK